MGTVTCILQTFATKCMQYLGLCSSYLFRSGNAEHPSDRFYNTSVEVLPESSLAGSSKIDYNATSDGYVIIGLYIITASNWSSGQLIVASITLYVSLMFPKLTSCRI